VKFKSNIILFFFVEFHPRTLLWHTMYYNSIITGDTDAYVLNQPWPHLGTPFTTYSHSIQNTFYRYILWYSARITQELNIRAAFELRRAWTPWTVERRRQYTVSKSRLSCPWSGGQRGL